PPTHGRLFSRLRGRAAASSAVVSRRNPAGAKGDGWYLRTATGHPKKPIAAATKGRSNSRHGIPTAWAVPSATSPPTLTHRASRCAADRCGPHPPATRDRTPGHRSRPNCKSSAESRPKPQQRPPPAFLGQFPKWPEFDDTRRHPGHASTASVTGNAGGDSG